MKNITFGNEENIFDRLLAGKAVRLNDPEYHKISQIIAVPLKSKIVL